MKLSKYLKTSRIKAGLIQKDVSEQMGYNSPQFCSNFERGKSKPSLNEVPKLASILNVDKNELYNQLMKYDVAKVKEKYKRLMNG